MEKYMKKNIYIYIHTPIYVYHFAVCQKLTHHCKSTILQFKKFKVQKMSYPATGRYGRNLNAYY